MQLSELEWKKSHAHIFHNLGYVYDEEQVSHENIINNILKQDKSFQIYLYGDADVGKSAMLINLLKDKIDRLDILDACSLHKDIRNSKEELCIYLRNSTKIAIREQNKIVEGEVISISQDKIILKTIDMESSFDIGVNIKKELKRERVVPGDIVRIYKDTGFICKIGRSSSQREELKSLFTKQISLPEGECFKSENVCSRNSLYEIDLANTALSHFDQIYDSKYYFNFSIKEEIDKRIIKMIKEGKASLERGILIIKNANFLCKELIDFINGFKYNELSPIVFMLSRTVDETILERMMVLRIQCSRNSKFSKIIEKKSEYLGLNIDSKALEYLISCAYCKGLKYALNILSITSDDAKKISFETLKTTESIFMSFDCIKSSYTEK